MRNVFRKRQTAPAEAPAGAPAADIVSVSECEGPHEGSTSSSSEMPTIAETTPTPPEAAPVKKFFPATRPVRRVPPPQGLAPLPSILKKKQVQGYEEESPISKQVQFNESLNQRHFKAANSKYERSCWYEKEELQLFAAVIETYASELASDSSTNEQSYRRVITNAYSACRSAQSLPESYSTPSSGGSILDDKQKQDLKKCIANGKNRFGLEKIIVKRLQNDANQRRAKMREAVQKKEAPEVLASNLEPISRPSRLFALEMGRAVSSCS